MPIASKYLHLHYKIKSAQMQLLFDNDGKVCYNTFKPIKSVRENGSLTTQQPAYVARC